MYIWVGKLLTDNLKRLWRKNCKFVRVPLLLLSFLLFLFLTQLLAYSMTLTTITIDGSFSDWQAVLSDTQNVVYDKSGAADPDNPSTANRDLTRFAFTWDNDYLYFYFRRTAAGDNAINYWVYIDTNNDGTLTASDYLLGLKFNGTSFNAGESGLFYYDPADPAGDAVTGDGVDEPGTFGSEISGASISGAGGGDGNLEVEVRVAWSSLSLSPGSPLLFHASVSNGTNIPKNVRDNTDPLSTQYTEVSIEPDYNGSAPSGTVKSYTHTVTNQGNATDTINLSASSSQGWTVTITDEASNTISSVTLGAGESTTVVVKIQIPGSATNGAEDETVITATSSNDSNISDTATDRTTVGSLTIIPDNSGSMTTNTAISYSHTVTNNTGSTLTVDLTSTSSQGWSTTIYDESGTTTITTVSIGPNSSLNIVVKVSIPSTATVGLVDVTKVQVQAEENSNYLDEAQDVTTVKSRVTIEPDREGAGGAGTSVSYRHTVTNSWNATDTINLSASSSQGWTVRIYDSAGLNEISSVTLGPNGESTEVVVRVDISSSATENTVDVTTITASSNSSSAQDEATDQTTVQRLVTYSDPGLTEASNFFRLGDTVYARGYNLGGYDEVRFQWIDANSQEVKLSPLIEVDTGEKAEDSYTLSGSEAVGEWTLILLDENNNEITRTNFTVSYKAFITELVATDAPDLNSLVYVDATLSNESSTAISNSSLNYVIWWDENGNETFDSGDVYIDSNGDPQTYDGTSTVSTHQTTGIDVSAGGTWSETDPGWSISNGNFPYRGTYRVTATWKSSSGLFIDEKTTTFYSVPTLGFVLLLFLGTVCGFLVYRFRRRRLWLLYYIFGGLGISFFAIYLAQITGLESVVCSWETFQLSRLAVYVGIPVQPASSSSVLLPSAEGWSLLKIGIECSAILEIAVLIGLLLFYPAFSWGKKLFFLGVGILGTYLINLLRLLLIIGMVNTWGRDVIFIAHALVGRVIFFALVVILYWYLITRPTLSLLNREVKVR